MRRLLALALLSATALPLARVADAQAQHIGCDYTQFHGTHTCQVDIQMDTINQTYNINVQCTNGYSGALYGLGYSANPCGNNPTEERMAP